MRKEKPVAKYDSDAGDGAGYLTTLLVGIPSLVVSAGAGIPLLYELTSNPVLAFAVAIPVGILAPSWLGKGVASYCNRSGKQKFKQDFISSLKLPEGVEPVFEDRWMESKYLELDRSTHVVKGLDSKEHATPGNPLYRMKNNKLYPVKPPAATELWDTSLLEIQRLYGLPTKKTAEDF